MLIMRKSTIFRTSLAGISGDTTLATLRKAIFSQPTDRLHYTALHYDVCVSHASQPQLSTLTVASSLRFSAKDCLSLHHHFIPEPDLTQTAPYVLLSSSFCRSLTNTPFTPSQKRFKAIVEAAGFSLVDNQIVDSSDDPEGKSRDKNVITSGPPRNAGNGSSKTKPKTDEKVNGSVKRKVSTATTVAATAPTNMNKEVAAKKRKFESTVVKQQSDDDGTDEQDENENGSAMRANNEI